MFQRFELHLIGKRPLTRQKLLALDVGIDHHQHGGIIVQIPNDDRHGLKPRHFTAALTPMPRYQLIAAFRIGSRNRGNQHAVFTDAVHRIEHPLVVAHLKRMISKRLELVKRNLLHPLALCIRSIFLGLKDIIDRFQHDVLRAAFQAPAPPSSTADRLPRPCFWAHRQRCSFPRRWFPPPAQSAESLFQRC